ELCVEVVRTETGRVDDPTTVDVAAGGPQRGVSVFGDDTGHPRATQQTCTALYGVGGKCEICCPGTDDRLAGHRQPRQRPRAEVGDPPVHLFGGDDLAVTVAVSFGFVLQARERIAPSSVHATRSAPVRSTGIPVCSA